MDEGEEVALGVLAPADFDPAILVAEKQRERGESEGGKGREEEREDEGGMGGKDCPHSRTGLEGWERGSRWCRGILVTHQERGEGGLLGVRKGGVGGWVGGRSQY